MATTETTGTTTPERLGRRDVSTSPPPGEGLITDRGATTIADGVVEKIADMAAREVRGVHDLTGGFGGTLRRLTPGMSERGAGASVEVGQRETAVDLDVIVDYGVSVPQLAQAVRDNVIRRVEHMTGLRVVEVNITVSDLFFAEEERQKRMARERERERGQAGRVE